MSLDRCPLCSKVLPDAAAQRELHVDFCLEKSQAQCHELKLPQTPQEKMKTSCTKRKRSRPFTSSTPLSAQASLSSKQSSNSRTEHPVPASPKSDSTALTLSYLPPEWLGSPVKQTPEQALKARQKSLHHFYLQSGVTVIPIPTYFFFDFQTMQAEFLCRRPALSISLSMPFTFDSASVPHELCTNMPSVLLHTFFDETQVRQGPPHILPTIQYPLAYLKSLLQKAIRRSSCMHAVMAAAHCLLQEDLADGAQQFYRRLPVIMLEDAVLMQSFTAIVWFMVLFSKKPHVVRPFIRHPAREQVNSENHIEKYLWWILGVVESIAAMKWRDPLPMSEPEPFDGADLSGRTETDAHVSSKRLKKNNYELELRSTWIEDLSSQQRSVLYAMRLRARFGGMNCDVYLMEHAIRQWTSRWLRGDTNSRAVTYFNEAATHSDCSTVILSSPFRKRITENNRWLKPDQWILAAVDFHVMTELPYAVWLRLPEPVQTEIKQWYNETHQVTATENEEDVMKTLIWVASSGLNNKQNVSGTGDDKDSVALNLWNEWCRSIFQSLALERLRKQIRCIQQVSLQ